MTEFSSALSWRPLRADDLPQVIAIADVVHAAYPEDPAIYADRLARFPDGCLALAGPQGLVGYVLSHPWRFGEPPSLNTLLGALPEAPDTYYLHDLALLPTTRGSGAGSLAVQRLREVAARHGLARLSLVAVNASAPFWRRQGFEVVRLPALEASLRSYEDQACFMATA